MMARTHARILTSIWADTNDFVGLTLEQQWTFFALLSQPTLSTCGVLTYQPKRLVRLAPGLTITRVRKAVAALHAAGYILIDPDTEELAFRTFLRNDGILKSPNLLKGAARSYEGIYSPTIRRAVLDQLPPGIQDLWPTAILTTDPKTIGAILSRNPSGNPSREPFAEPSANHRSTSLIPDPFPLSPVPGPSAEGSRRNGSSHPEPAAAAAGEAGAADADPQGSPPAELLARFGKRQPHSDDLGPDGWGDPEATGPDESPDDRTKRRAMAVRLRDTIGTADLLACNRTVAEALHDVDARIVDEQIGWLAEATDPPRTPGVLLTAIRRMVQ